MLTEIVDVGMEANISQENATDNILSAAPMAAI